MTWWYDKSVIRCVGLSDTDYILSRKPHTLFGLRPVYEFPQLDIIRIQPQLT